LQRCVGPKDGVDYHWWDLMKAAALSTLLGMGTELATSEENQLIRAICDGAQDTFNQAGQQIVQRQLQVAHAHHSARLPGQDHRHPRPCVRTGRRLTMTKLKFGPLPAARRRCVRLIVSMLECSMARDRRVQRPGGPFHRTESGYFFEDRKSTRLNSSHVKN